MRPQSVRSTALSLRLLTILRETLSRCVLVLAFVTTFLGLNGCGGGGGGIAFSGGGVPIGKAILSGKVVRAEDPSLVLYNAQITLVATPQTSPAQILHAASDHNGVFTITDIPTDAVNGQVSLTVSSADSNFKTQQVSFLLVNNHSASVIVTLPPADYTPTVGTTLSILPTHITLQKGQNVQFTTHLTDPQGHAILLTPTLFFDDSFGILDPDGTFNSTGDGTGDIVAYWYNGLKTSCSVVVQSLQQVAPPAPPSN